MFGTMLAPPSNFEIKDFSCFSNFEESAGNFNWFDCCTVFVSLLDLDKAMRIRFETAVLTISSQPWNIILN